MSGRILLLFISHHPPLLFRPACCAVECKAELRPRGRRRASATPGRRGRHLPEVRGGARDQRFPSAGQVGEKLFWRNVDEDDCEVKDNIADQVEGNVKGGVAADQRVQRGRHHRQRHLLCAWKARWTIIAWSIQCYFYENVQWLRVRGSCTWRSRAQQSSLFRKPRWVPPKPPRMLVSPYVLLGGDHQAVEGGVAQVEHFCYPPHQQGQIRGPVVNTRHFPMAKLIIGCLLIRFGRFLLPEHQLEQIMLFHILTENLWQQLAESLKAEYLNCTSAFSFKPGYNYMSSVSYPHLWENFHHVWIVWSLKKNNKFLNRKADIQWLIVFKEWASVKG